MTTVTDFVPMPRGKFQWQLQLDGAFYVGSIAWNLFGQRWYLTVAKPTNEAVLTVPLTGSPTPASVGAYDWDEIRRVVTVTTSQPHGLRIGSLVERTISRAVPETFNGTSLMTVTGPNTLTYDADTDPGVNIMPGYFGYDHNLIRGYFASKLVFRQQSRQLEVSP